MEEISVGPLVANPGDHRPGADGEIGMTPAGPTPGSPSAKLCGLEGMPGTGKSQICGRLPGSMVSPHAGSDVTPSQYPRLERDGPGGYGLLGESLARRNDFFFQREIRRTADLRKRGELLLVLDRTWISQIVVNHAFVAAFGLGLGEVRAVIDRIEAAVCDRVLYYPDWLVLFRIPGEVSYRKVVHRDGTYFDDNMIDVASLDQRREFLRARGRAYRMIAQSAGLPIRELHYQAHPDDKLAATRTPPGGPVDARRFFSSIRAALAS